MDSTTKPILKTYSRQRKRRTPDDEPPLKRRCIQSGISLQQIEEPQSSSSHRSSSPRIFSDANVPESPPSSPPSSQTTSPKTTDTIYDKTQRIPLLERSQTLLNKSKRKSLVQLKIDLGWQTRKLCKDCGMEYIPSDTEDAAVHKKFHTTNLGGVDMDKAYLDQRRANAIWSNDQGDFILAIGRKSSLASRKRAIKVLTVVNAELHAVAISDEDLWSEVSRASDVEQQQQQQPAGTSTKPLGTLDRFKAFLYIKGQKCVGMCLAESLSKACTVLAPEDAASGINQPLSSPASTSSMIVSTKPEKAMMGISRIWTSGAHRKANVARNLLDCAVDNFLYGLKVPKSLVAFSQPTDSGFNLARKWFGQDSGWHVYVN
ncbi:hypothetical protein EJ05DRAFT_507999 [Pseudovirgaria hyperparasitica]|uniref:Sister chromatid cohesion acetyltransferas-like protein Eco1 n=1 Tax=Pseudovirgaria hyperparasitica TaxID=470096 RepID=A0A6A6WDF6_9PEZI|nr:uncharacterized protein EJ05DRAFT_507999 [Pseudovirgaria hyperparasitica]KAF2760743.1 hypothetical protein EJ05DRAFT_507999 [Pseudovirgaria hyperparasitica]